MPPSTRSPNTFPTSTETAWSTHWRRCFSKRRGSAAADAGSASRSRSTVREAGVGRDVALGLRETLATALSLGATVLALLGLELVVESLQVGLKGVVGLVVLVQ